MRGVTTSTFVGLCTLVLPATPVAAAPALKDGRAEDGEADLKGLHALVRTTVKAGKWWPLKDEQRAGGTLRLLLERVCRAGELPERGLPVDFDSVEKVEVAKSIEQTSLKKAFVIGGDVRGTTAENSIIFAAGEVKFTSVRHCVIVGQTVRFTSAMNCVIVADQLVRGTGVRAGPDDKAATVLVAGRWIRLTGAEKAVCHVLTPSDDPSPEERGPSPAIRMTSASGVLFLNAPKDVANRDRGNRWVEPNAPLGR